MGLERQADFGGGIFRSPRAPRGSVYDCVDGLVDDELAIFRRGGTVYRSDSQVQLHALRGLASQDSYAGERVLMWDDTALWVLDPDDHTPRSMGSQPQPLTCSRFVPIGGLLVYRDSVAPKVWFYGGSRLLGDYTLGTVTTTVGSKIVTGAGTGWNAGTVDKGMVFTTAGVKHGLVESVDSTTQITLRDPADVAVAGAAYTLSRFLSTVALSTPIPAGPRPPDAIGTAGGRLLVGIGNRVYMSPPNDVLGVWSATDYHELPLHSQVIGIEGVGNDALIFTSAGVWLIGSMELDLTDASGNPQQPETQVSKDVVAWSDNGIAGMSRYAGLIGWRGQVVVPALDDVYMLGAGGDPVPISRGIRPLYRGYVQSDTYTLGTATVFQGHYFLPIVTIVAGAPTVVDLLVCRLDQRDSRGAIRPAWTRLSGFARGVAFASRWRVDDPPALLGTNVTSPGRVTDVTGVFFPTATNKNDGDGTTHNLDITLNDLEPGSKSTLQRVRVHAEIVDAASDNPTLAGSYAVDAPEGAALIALPGVMSESTDVPKVWSVVKRGRRFRLRLLSSGAASKLRVRIVEWFVRDSNRP